MSTGALTASGSLRHPYPMNCPMLFSAPSRTTSSATVCILLLSSVSACGGPATGQQVSHAAEAEATVTADSPVPRAPVDSGSILAAMDGAHRPDAHRARDAFRHPKETLEFFGIDPSMTVVELWPGGGWYTAILAPYLRRQGKLRAAVPSSSGGRARYRERFVSRLEEQPSVYDQVELVTLDPPEEIDLGEAGSADMVLTFRNSHNWMREETQEAVYRAAFEVLRPGGTFGIVQHRAPEGEATLRPESGYIPQAQVIELAEEIGFVLEGSSEINANPNDTTQHPEGVWTLPPVLRLGDQNREQYLAIGESDRMTLRFRKP